MLRLVAIPTGFSKMQAFLRLICHRLGFRRVMHIEVLTNFDINVFATIDFRPIPAKYSR